MDASHRSGTHTHTLTTADVGHNHSNYGVWQATQNVWTNSGAIQSSQGWTTVQVSWNPPQHQHQSPYVGHTHQANVSWYVPLGSLVQIMNDGKIYITEQMIDDGWHECDGLPLDPVVYPHMVPILLPYEGRLPYMPDHLMKVRN